MSPVPVITITRKFNGYFGADFTNQFFCSVYMCLRIYVSMYICYPCLCMYFYASMSNYERQCMYVYKIKHIPNNNVIMKTHDMSQ